MDNRKIEIISADRYDLATGVEMIFKEVPGKKATHWKTNEDGTVLAIYWGTPHKGKRGPGYPEPLPYEMGTKPIIAFLQGWLDSAPKPESPEMDGSWRDGFHLLHHEWSAPSYEILTLRFVWALYGK